MRTFNNLVDNRSVSPRGLEIAAYCTSVQVKLHGSMTYLNSLLSVKKWDSPNPTPFIPISNATNATTGSTIPTGAATTTPSLSNQAMNVSSDLDSFFESLASSFDVLAQIVNLVYLDPPKRADDVTFHEIVDDLIAHPQGQNETITPHLTRVRGNGWYKAMKSFRKSAHHTMSIDYEIVYERSSFRPLKGDFPPYDVKAILLPDNPRSHQPNYSKKRSVHVLCVTILKNALDRIDTTFLLMETRIGTAGKVPV